MARVVVLGSSNIDMIVGLGRLPAPGQTVLGGAFRSGLGGKGANQAVAARRAGAEVVFLAAVGDDDLGRRAIEAYRREGIDCDHVRVVPGVASGVALIFLDQSGENMIGVAPGANALLLSDDIDRVPEPVFAAGGVFLASLEVPLATVAHAVRRAAAAGMTVVLNPAPASEEVIDCELLRQVDVVVPNRGEALILTGWGSGAKGLGMAANYLRARGASRVVITLGAQGCFVRSETEEVRIPSPKVDAVDAVAAGDAFCGALAVALAEGRPLVEGASWAAAAGALAVTRPGAVEAMPSRTEIDRLAHQAAADPSDLASRSPSWPSVAEPSE